MKKIETDKAPRAIGPYSQAVIAGDFIFCSGQLAFDSASGEFIGGDIKVQTALALQNLAAVLRAANASLAQVVSVNVYLKNMSDFAGMNEVYAKEFAGHEPARVTVGISELPKNALVEISCVGLVHKNKFHTL